MYCHSFFMHSTCPPAPLSMFWASMVRTLSHISSHICLCITIGISAMTRVAPTLHTVTHTKPAPEYPYILSRFKQKKRYCFEIGVSIGSLYCQFLTIFTTATAIRYINWDNIKFHYSPLPSQCIRSGTSKNKMYFTYWMAARSSYRDWNISFVVLRNR